MKGFRAFVGYKGQPALGTLLRRCQKLGGDVVAGTPKFPVYRVEVNSQAKTTIVMVAGHHGDEPAGPLGLLDYLEDRPDPEVRILAFPLLNPAGYDRGTREDRKGHDLNRQFFSRRGDAQDILKAVHLESIRFLLSLHEDPEADGFYCYQQNCKPLANKVRDLADEEYFKIFKEKQRKPLPGEPLPKDRGLIKDGIISPPHVARNTLEDRLWAQGVPYFVPETPGTAELADRVRFMKEVCTLAVEYTRRAK